MDISLVVSTYLCFCFGSNHEQHGASDKHEKRHKRKITEARTRDQRAAVDVSLRSPVSHLRSMEQLTCGLGAHNRTETFRKQLRPGVHRFPPSLSRISCSPVAGRDRRQRPVTNYILLAQSRPRVHLRPSRSVSLARVQLPRRIRSSFLAGPTEFSSVLSPYATIFLLVR